MPISSEQARRSEVASPEDAAAAQAARNFKDIVGGIAAIAIAVFFIVPSFDYKLGSPSRMGAGFFPLALGVILAIIGLLILLPALRGAGAPLRVSWRPAVAVLASIGTFGFVIERFGLIPAVCLAVAIAALGNRGARPHRVGVLAIVVSILTWLIFVYGLAVPLPVIRMP